MSLLALLMGGIMSGGVMIYGNQPLDEGLVPQVEHRGFSKTDERQQMVQRAYELGGSEFVFMIECENGNRDVNAKGDGGHAFGLCQMNNRFHKIPKEYFGNWRYQLEYCYKKWSTGTPFYGPTRITHGMKCKDYVRSRFSGM